MIAARTIVGALVLAACAATAAAQNCTAVGNPASCSPGSRTVSLDIRTTVQVTVSPSVADFGNPTPADFTQGYTEALGHSVEVRANTTWVLSIRSSRSTWLASGGGRTNKPRSDLLWATSSGGPYTAMPGNNNASAITIATGTATASSIVPVYYRVLWSWTLDVAGTYSLPVVLRLSAP